MSSKEARGVKRRPAAAAAAPEGPGAAPKAPAAGKQMHPATLAEFQQFLQCQLKKEAQVHLGSEDIELVDPKAKAMWPEYDAFVRPNLGRNERWVPYHTVLGVHEKFLMEGVHHSNHGWDEYQRFQAIFVFRAHCKADLFTTAQLPLMKKKDFWKDPKQTCKPGGVMEKAILDYRKRTKRPLLTLCFRMIPERLLPDDDENLVRNIVLRTGRLLELAEKIYPIVKDNKKKAAAKFDEISAMVQEAQGLGETWAKMLMVCIDLAYPDIGLLASQCEVGVGAITPLRRLLPNGGPPDTQDALEKLRKEFNGSKDASARNFWAVLQKVEQGIRRNMKNLPLILKQVNTKPGGLTAGTLQVQLCEYRQFRHAIARSRYGLPLDESMKEPEREKRLRPEDYIVRDEKRKLVKFEYQEKGSEPVPFQTSVAAVHGSWKLAERIAILCFGVLRAGGTLKEAQSKRDMLNGQAKKAKDVPENSKAWEVCRVQQLHCNPVVSFSYQKNENSPKECFQTTSGACGGLMEADRIARLCYAKFEAGATKQEVLEFRNRLYEQANGMPDAKRRKGGA